MNELGVVYGETGWLEEVERWKDMCLLMLETMGALQQGKPYDLRLACRDIHATAQHVLLDAALF